MVLVAHSWLGCSISLLPFLGILLHMKRACFCALVSNGSTKLLPSYVMEARKLYACHLARASPCLIVVPTHHVKLKHACCSPLCSITLCLITASACSEAGTERQTKRQRQDGAEGTAAPTAPKEALKISAQKFNLVKVCRSVPCSR